MNHYLRRTTRGLLRRAGLKRDRGPHARVSFSQQGEDLLAWDLLKPRPGRSGFYVDVGAHHPSKYSNTKIFYDYGWSGLNIDPLPGAADLFRRERPRDGFVSAGIAAERGELTYHMFREPAFNGFDADRSQQVEGSGAAACEIVAEIPVPVLPLAEVLTEHLPRRLPPGGRIDLLNVDVEGLDLAVLKSNDWTAHRPRVVLAEVQVPGGENRFSRLEGCDTGRFLIERDYAPASLAGCTALFRDLRD